MCSSISWSTCRTFFSIRAYVIDVSATTFIAPSSATPKSVSPTWRRFRDAFRRHPTALIGGVILICMVAIAIFAPWLGTIDPQAVAPIQRRNPPSADFWFGTDMLGRDVYSRVVYGARVSLIVGLAVAMFSTILGIAIGLVTGYVRVLDAVVMRVMDALMSISSVLLAIALMALTKASVGNVVFAITLAEVPRVVRLVRSLVLSLREQPDVEAAIGAATPPNIPSWGNIMAEARSLFQIAGYLILFPGLFLSLTVLAVNLLGDGMRDALDPRLARRM